MSDEFKDYVIYKDALKNNGQIRYNYNWRNVRGEIIWVGQ